MSLVPLAFFGAALVAATAAACGDDGRGTPPSATSTPTPGSAAQRISYIGADLDVWIVEADGSGERKLFDVLTVDGDSLHNLQWAPDGKKVAVTRGPKNVVYIISGDGEKLLEIPAVSFLTWAPGSDMFAVARSQALEVDAALVVVDLQGEQVVEIPNGGEPSFSADGGRLAFFEFSGGGPLFPGARGMIADLSDSRVSPVVPGELASEDVYLKGPPLFSPTGPDLLTYGDRLLDLAGAGESLLPAIAVLWSPDGRRLAVRQNPGAHAIIDVERQQLISELRLVGVQGDPPPWYLDPLSNAWSPDGDLVATCLYYGSPEQQGLRVWDLTTNTETVLNQDTARFLRFSSDGQWLLYVAAARSDRAGTVSLVRVDGSGLAVLGEASESAWPPPP